MNFVRKHIDSLEILQKFIDNGGVIYGESVRNILFENVINVVKIYLPSDEVIANLDQLETELTLTYGQCEIKQVTENKKLWKINHLYVLTTTTTPKIKLDGISNICISNNGISTIYEADSLTVLKFLRRFNNKDDFDDPYVNMAERWTTYFLNNGHNIYGSWPSRYITVTQSDEMHRDIDISTNNYKSISDMMNLLIDTNIAFTSNDVRKYTDTSLKVELPTNAGKIFFDIHKESSNMSCDAFYNNLRLTKQYLTINYQPPKLNFLGTLVLTFRDLFFDSYTLIKPLPTRVDTVGEFRLIVKPLLFSNTHKVNYDYLEYSKEEDDTIIELNDILTNNKCYKKCNHDPDNHFGVPSTTVIKLGKKFKCLECIYTHVVIQKEIQDKRKRKEYYTNIED